MVGIELEQTIRDAAYLKWEQAGRPDGDGLDFWLQSERELLSQTNHDGTACCEQQPCEQESATSDQVKSETESVSVITTDPSLGESSLGESNADAFQQDSRGTRRSRRRTTKEV
jgi:hypothetical protein